MPLVKPQQEDDESHRLMSHKWKDKCKDKWESHTIESQKWKLEISNFFNEFDEFDEIPFMRLLSAMLR